MAKIYSNRPTAFNFVPGSSYKDAITIVPGDNTIPDKCLDDDYIKSLVADGSLVLPLQVTGVGTDLPEDTGKGKKKTDAPEDTGKGA
jgi:hypothetical protein